MGRQGGIGWLNQDNEVVKDSAARSKDSSVFGDWSRIIGMMPKERE
jgi:hypothetical protein